MAFQIKFDSASSTETIFVISKLFIYSTSKTPGKQLFHDALEHEGILHI